MQNKSFFKIWLEKLSIQSFAISVCPVIMATAMAFGDGVYNFKKAGLCLGFIIILQSILKLLNLYFGYKLPFEEILSFLTLGPFTVSATYYFQSNELNYAIVLLGISAGLIISSIFAIKNLKEMEEDVSKDGKTLTMILGTSVEEFIFVFSLILGLLLPVIVYLLINDHIHIILSSLLIILCVPMLKKIFSEADTAAYNSALTTLEFILIFFTMIISTGWII